MPAPSKNLNLPPGTTASAILSGRAENPKPGQRWEDDKDVRTVGFRVREQRLSAQALAFLREMNSPQADRPVIRSRIALKDRVQWLRRSNPRDPASIDRAIEQLLIHAIVIEQCEQVMVRREGIAAWLKVPEHFVSQSLERLNKQGLVGPEINRGPHDSRRDPWGGTTSAWHGSIRYARKERVERLADALANQPDAAEHAAGTIRRRTNRP